MMQPIPRLTRRPRIVEDPVLGRWLCGAWIIAVPHAINHAHPTSGTFHGMPCAHWSRDEAKACVAGRVARSVWWESTSGQRGPCGHFHTSYAGARACARVQADEDPAYCWFVQLVAPLSLGLAGDIRAQQRAEGRGFPTVPAAEAVPHD